MRRAASSLLVAITLGGCNQIFGLQETSAIPDAPPADGAWAIIHVGYLQHTFDPTATMPSQPVEVPFPDLTMVEVGPIDGPTVMRPVDAGIVTIPPEISGAKFRLIYQRPGDITREYQGLVPDAHVIEPLFGPVARTTPVAGSGLDITPVGYVGSHAVNRVYTVGTWTEGEGVDASPPAGKLTYNYVGTVSLSGPPGATSVTDRAVLVDYNQVAPCLVSRGSTDVAAGLISPRQAVAGPWVTTIGTQPTTSTPNNIRFTAGVSPFGETIASATELYGFVPSAVMPAFTRPPDFFQRLVALPNPVMVVLRRCNTNNPQTALDTNAAINEPTLLTDHLTPGLYTEVVAPRTIPNPIGGIATSVDNGLGIFTPGPGNLNVDSKVAFANNVQLKIGSATTSLMGGAEEVAVGSAAGGVTLSWTKESAERADYWEVTVSSSTGALFTVTRIYTTTLTEVRIPGADLPPGRYLLKISAFTGRPGAAMADFRAVQGAQSISVLHPRTFVVN